MSFASLELPRPETIARFTVAVAAAGVVKRYKQRRKPARWTPDAILAYQRERRARNVAKGLRADGTPRTPRVAKWSKNRKDYHRARRAAFRKAGLASTGKPLKVRQPGPYGPSKPRTKYMQRYRAAIYQRDLCPA